MMESSRESTALMNQTAHDKNTVQILQIAKEVVSDIFDAELQNKNAEFDRKTTENMALLKLKELFLEETTCIKLPVDNFADDYELDVWGGRFFPTTNFENIQQLEESVKDLYAKKFDMLSNLGYPEERKKQNEKMLDIHMQNHRTHEGYLEVKRHFEMIRENDPNPEDAFLARELKELQEMETILSGLEQENVDITRQWKDKQEQDNRALDQKNQEIAKTVEDINAALNEITKLGIDHIFNEISMLERKKRQISDDMSGNETDSMNSSLEEVVPIITLPPLEVIFKDPNDFPTVTHNLETSKNSPSPKKQYPKENSALQNVAKKSYVDTALQQVIKKKTLKKRGSVSKPKQLVHRETRSKTQKMLPHVSSIGKLTPGTNKVKPTKELVQSLQPRKLANEFMLFESHSDAENTASEIAEGKPIEDECILTESPGISSTKQPSPKSMNFQQKRSPIPKISASRFSVDKNLLNAIDDDRAHQSVTPDDGLIVEQKVNEAILADDDEEEAATQFQQPIGLMPEHQLSRAGSIESGTDYEDIFGDKSFEGVDAENPNLNISGEENLSFVGFADGSAFDGGDFDFDDPVKSNPAPTGGSFF